MTDKGPASELNIADFISDRLAESVQKLTAWLERHPQASREEAAEKLYEFAMGDVREYSQRVN